MQIEMRAILDLRPHPLNVRGEISEDSVRELADSIRENGLIEPLVATPDGMVIAGHRRLLASRLAGLREVPVIRRTATETEIIELMLIENLQREDLSPMQEAAGYLKLREAGLTVSAIVRRTGINKPRIENHLALTRLSERTRERILAGLSMYCAPLLARLPETEQDEWSRRAAQLRWSAAELREAMKAGDVQFAKGGRIRQVDQTTATRVVITREVALNSLSRPGNFPVSLQLFVRAVAQISCHCAGLEEARAKKMCSDCPFAQFLGQLLREVHDAKA